MTAIDVARNSKDNGAVLFRYRKGSATATAPPDYDMKPWGTGNKRGWTVLDTFTASAIVAVYDGLNAQNQAKYIRMPFARMAELAFKLCK